MATYRFEITSKLDTETVDDAMDILHLQLGDVVIESKITLFDGNNSFEHEIAKLRICYDLIKSGKEVFTEAIFDNGSRADIVVLDDFKIIEVLYSEDEVACLEKSKRYPALFELEMVKVNNNDT